MANNTTIVIAAAACGILIGYAVASNIHQRTRRREADFRRRGRGQAAVSVYPYRVKERRHGDEGVEGDRVCIVTGGSRGIGAAVCRRLGTEGYRVAVNYATNKKQAEEVVNDIIRAGGTAMAVKADVSVLSEVDRMFDQVEAEMGPITSCVNNAGIIGPLSGLMAEAETTLQQLPRVLAVNLYGPFHVLYVAARRMRNAGSIVNVSAGSAFTGSPLCYAISKGALNSLTAGSVKELAQRRIRINTVSPGPTYTDMMNPFSQEEIDGMCAAIPFGRAGDAEEIAAGIAWLLSPDASYVSGTNLRIGGGKPLEA